MTKIISDIKNLMKNKQLMSINEIYKNLEKMDYAKYGPRGMHTLENLKETIMHYSKLNALYVDDDENVVFL